MPPKNKAENETVILLHGILRSKTDMILLEKDIAKLGYNCINILYPSRSKNLEDLTQYIENEIQAHDNYNRHAPIHFVTHSMGGLLARYYIATHKPENLGKVIMLSPPNTGSEFADFFTNNKLFSSIYKSLFGPAGQQLVTSHEHPCGNIDYPLGIIAGSSSINPLAPFILNDEHDGIVPVERTKLDGMCDHITLKSNHSLMMFDPKVIKQVIYFLENDRFER